MAVKIVGQRLMQNVINGKQNHDSGRMMADLHDALVELQSLSRTTDNNESCVKAVVFMSDDPTFFCSGGDLDTVRAIFNHEGGYKMATLMPSCCLLLAILLPSFCHLLAIGSLWSPLVSFVHLWSPRCQE